MKFEFEPVKSKAHHAKRGIRLEAATRIWEEGCVEVAARTVDEARGMAIGPVAGTLYACVDTLRGEAVRLISCRRASQREARLYHEHFKDAHAEREVDRG